MKKLSRRQFLIGSSAAVASTMLAISGYTAFADQNEIRGGSGDKERSRYELRPIQHRNLFADRHLNAFPSIVKKRDGSLLIAFRQAPDWRKRYGITEADPASKAIYLTSLNGEAWGTEATDLYDHFSYGVNNPVLHVLDDGSLFCTFYTWKVVAKTGLNANAGLPVFDKWLGTIEGMYSIRSADGGLTWDQPARLPNNNRLSGHSAQLSDGSILCADYGDVVTVYKTNDRGLTWNAGSTIASPAGFSLQQPTLFRTNSGRVVCFMHGVRKGTSGSLDESRLITAESTDNGATWKKAVVRKLAAASSYHLLQLHNGNVLLTYKQIRESVSICGAVLNPECNNVDEAEHDTLRDDGLGTDAGNTSAVQIGDNTFLVTYSNSDRSGGPGHIAGTLCELVHKGK